MIPAHNYNTRQNPVPVDENAAITPESTNFSELFLKLEKTMLSRFDGVDKELLNLKDIVIKNLQLENQKLRAKVGILEKKITTLEENGNQLEQYGRRNNLEITGIPDSIDDKNLEGKVIEILGKIDVKVSGNDIEACHRIGKSRDNSKKTIIRFVNRKNAKKALLNRKELKTIGKSSIGLSNTDIFINENLTPMNNKLAFICRKLKKDGHIDKTLSRDGMVCFSSQNIQNGKTIKVLHLNTLIDTFPDLDFGEDNHNTSVQ